MPLFLIFVSSLCFLILHLVLFSLSSAFCSLYLLIFHHHRFSFYWCYIFSPFFNIHCIIIHSSLPRLFMSYFSLPYSFLSFFLCSFAASFFHLFSAFHISSFLSFLLRLHNNVFASFALSSLFPSPPISQPLLPLLLLSPHLLSLPLLFPSFPLLLLNSPFQTWFKLDCVHKCLPFTLSLHTLALSSVALQARYLNEVRFPLSHST